MCVCECVCVCAWYVEGGVWVKGLPLKNVNVIVGVSVR